MKVIIQLMKTKLKLLFFSPIAWLILIVFAVQAGVVFTDSVHTYFSSQMSGGENVGLTARIFGTLLGSMIESLFLYVPLLTMGLMSREFSSGSIKLLYSSPVSDRQIIGGKYLAMIVLGLILSLIICVPVIVGALTIEHFDIGQVLVALGAFFLIFCAYAAIGLFLSTVTSYQVVAALGSIAVLAVLTYIGKVGQGMDVVRDITGWLCVAGRTRDMLKGVIGTSDFFYFLLIVFLFLELSVLKLRGDRLKWSMAKQSAYYSTAVVIMLGCGLLTSLPAMKFYYDGTEKKLNTVTDVCKELLKQMPDNLKITTYVNYLDYRNYFAMPDRRLEDMKRFEKYIRFKPDIKMEYVYYYHHHGASAEWPARPGFHVDLPDKERMELLADLDDLNPDMFLPADRLPADIDLEKEDYRTFRQLEYGNKRKAMLRVYDDMRIHPSETEVANTLKSLIEGSPVIAFTTGHGERNPYSRSDKGIGALLTVPEIRSSLVNQGYAVKTLTLDQPVNDKVDLLVLADVCEALSEEELAKVKAYVDGGGNLLLMADAGMCEAMNPIASFLGMEFCELDASSEKQDETRAIFVPERNKAGLPCWESFPDGKFSFLLPTAVGIRQTEEKGYQVERVLETAKGSVPLMCYLTRQLKDREQRIMIWGDTDFMTWDVMKRNRPNGALSGGIFETLTYGRFPIYAPEPQAIDNTIIATPEELDLYSFVLKYGIPLLWLLGMLIVAFSRRKR